MMNLIMLGAPGAGKGTQAAILNQKLGIPTISTGNILRAAVKDGTPIGLKAKEYMDHGHLVPDEVIIGIINERLQAEDCKKGYILDGVPRTIAQAEALDKAGIVFDAVINLEISDEEILQRMSGRRVCESSAAPATMLWRFRQKWKAFATPAAARWFSGQTMRPRRWLPAWRSITAKRSR